MKENVKNVSEKQGNMRLNTVNFTKITSLQTCDWLKITKLFTKCYFIFCIYKMYLISAEGHKNASVHFLRVRKTGEI